MPTPEAKEPPIILASESPRRRELLAALGLVFAVQPADVDETPMPGEVPEALALRLSHAKAEAVARQAPESLVIAADTLVVLEGEVLGKPASRREALQMLRRLRGRIHQVVTGLTLRLEAADIQDHQVAFTYVAMRSYRALEMLLYVASGDPLDKAGGYAIQSPFFAPVARLDNCYANVVGLPLCHLYRALACWGVEMHHPLDVCPWPLKHGGCEWAGRILDE
jgi:septum formation protein